MKVHAPRFLGPLTMIDNNSELVLLPFKAYLSDTTIALCLEYSLVWIPQIYCVQSLERVVLELEEPHLESWFFYSAQVRLRMTIVGGMESEIYLLHSLWHMDCLGYGMLTWTCLNILWNLDSQPTLHYWWDYCHYPHTSCILQSYLFSAILDNTTTLT